MPHVSIAYWQGKVLTADLQGIFVVYCLAVQIGKSFIPRLPTPRLDVDIFSQPYSYFPIVLNEVVRNVIGAIHT